MKPTKSPIEYLTTREAAEVAGMSRIAFRKHVIAKRILPDNMVGGRGVFSRPLVEAFRDMRAANGAKKRGPKPAVAQ